MKGSDAIVQHPAIEVGEVVVLDRNVRYRGESSMSRPVYSVSTIRVSLLLSPPTRSYPL